MVKQPQAQSPQRVIRDIQLLRAQKSKVYQKRNLSTYRAGKKDRFCARLQLLGMVTPQRPKQV